MPRTFLLCCSMACLVVFFATIPARAASVAQLELAYVYKFLSFVTLSDTASSEITVVVFGRDKFGDHLKALTKKKVRGKEIVVKEGAAISDIQGCHVVLITTTASVDIAGALKRAEGLKCLTIGDVDNFIDQGGMIGFVSRRGRLRFEINQKIAQAHGIKINSNLLEVASKVIR